MISNEATKIFMPEWDFHSELLLARFQLNARAHGDSFSHNLADRFERYSTLFPDIHRAWNTPSPYYDGTHNGARLRRKYLNPPS